MKTLEASNASPQTVEQAPREHTAEASGPLLLVTVCFFLSGLAALVYQTAWMRQFATVFGTSEPAVASVLAAYMSGLALGAFLAGRFLARVTRPILAYGLLELGVAMGAVALPLGLALVRSLHASLGGGLAQPPDAGGGGQIAFYLIATFALVLVPTTFMGATLPLLARHAVRKDSEIGKHVGWLYTFNTVGAVLGTILAAFFLLPRLGLQATVWVGVAINVLVFACAVLLAKRAPVDGKAPVVSSEQPDSAPSPSPRAKFILPMMAISGAVAFTYEVLWTRLMGHMLGASVYAFATMLASFLAGIAIGSAIASRHATTFKKSVAGFSGVQFGLAVCSLSVFIAMRFLPELQTWLGAGEDAGVGKNAMLAGMVLLPSTICLGATFPFAVRILAHRASEAGRASARVFSWNTVGGTLGALAAGFFLIPLLDFQGTIRLCVLCNLGLAIAAQFLMTELPKRPLANLAFGTLLIAIFFRPSAPDEVLRSSPFAEMKTDGEIVWSEVGSSASVMVMKQGADYQVRVNGLPQAAIAAKGALPWSGRHNRWLSALPLLARPQAESVCIVGLGGGVAAEDLPETVQEIDIFELSHEVISANRFLSSVRNADPLADPRVRLIENDARSAFDRTTKRWDVIVSQPSHPWTAGASHLYTSEFCRIVEDHLSEDGVFLQWVSTRAFDMDLLKTYGATLLAEFEYVRLYQSSTSTPLFLASNAPLDIEADLQQNLGLLASHPEPFHWLGLSTVEDVAARLTFDTAALTELCAGVPPNTDDANRIALRPPSFGARPAAVNMEDLLAPLAVVDRFAETLDGTAIVRRLCSLGMIERAERVAESIEDPLRRALALESLAQGTGDYVEAGVQYQAARELNAEDPGVAWGYFVRNIENLDRESDETQRQLGTLPPAPRAVVEAWNAYLTLDWETLSSYEDDLATAHSNDPWFLIATQLRCFWRVHKDVDPEQRHRNAAEALTLVDRLIALGPSHATLGLRAEAAALSDHPHELIEAAELFALVLPSKIGEPANREQALRIAYDLGRLEHDSRVDGARAATLASRLQGLCMMGG